MAKGVFRLEVNNSRFQRILNKYSKTINEKSALMDQELAASGELMVTSAKNILSGMNVSYQGKNYVGVDTGRLRNSISFKKDQFLSYYMVAQTNYAAYIEFGTGAGFVQLPEKAWNDIAQVYKGTNSKRVNLPPRPYMRPSINAYWPEYQKRVRTILNKKTQA